MANKKIETAKVALRAEIKAAERRFMERVGPLADCNDDFYLTRQAVVRHLREHGLKFREIGERFGVTGQQARMLFLKSERYFK